MLRFVRRWRLVRSWCLGTPLVCRARFAAHLLRSGGRSTLCELVTRAYSPQHAEIIPIRTRSELAARRHRRAVVLASSWGRCAAQSVRLCGLRAPCTPSLRSYARLAVQLAHARAALPQQARQRRMDGQEVRPLGLHGLDCIPRYPPAAAVPDGLLLQYCALCVSW